MKHGGRVCVSDQSAAVCGSELLRSPGSGDADYLGETYSGLGEKHRNKYRLDTCTVGYNVVNTGARNQNVSFRVSLHGHRSKQCVGRFP